MHPQPTFCGERMRVAQRIASQYIQSGTIPCWFANSNAPKQSLDQCGATTESAGDHRPVAAKKKTRWAGDDRIVDQLLSACLRTSHVVSSTIKHPGDLTSSQATHHPLAKRQARDPTPSTPRKRPRRPPWDDSTAPRRHDPTPPAEWVLHVARHAQAEQRQQPFKGKGRGARPKKTPVKASTAARQQPKASPQLLKARRDTPIRAHNTPTRPPPPKARTPHKTADVTAAHKATDAASVTAIASLVVDHIMQESVAGWDDA